MSIENIEDLPEDINRNAFREQESLKENSNSSDIHEESSADQEKKRETNECVYIPEEVYESLPDILKELTALFTGRERDVVLLSSLSALSGLMPNVFGMYDGRKVYTNLYLMIVAPPASGKGVMNFAKHLIMPIHKKLYNDSVEAQRACEEKNKINKTSIPCPPVVVKIIPGNTSSAEFYSMMQNADYGAIMIESEGDTLSNALRQDFGNFSDVLRKAFQHEDLSLSRRTDRIYLEISEPQLSLVISGTQDQVLPIVKSKENGLFSRFIYYTFNDTDTWKDVFKVDNKLKQAFIDLGLQKIYPLYAILRSNKTSLEFKLTEYQQDRFNSQMSNINNIVNDDYPLLFSSSVRRHGLILFRLLMIVAVLRKESNLDSTNTLYVTDSDFESMLRLTKEVLRHSLSIFLSIGEAGLNQIDDDLLYSLSEIFTREQAIELGETMGLAKRTIDYKLKIWTNKKFIKKIKHGQYKRL